MINFKRFLFNKNNKICNDLISQHPLIYFYLDNNKEIIYIGQTSCFDKRHKQHLRNDSYMKEVKTIWLMPVKTKDFLTITETYFIKEIQPKYNIKEKFEKDPSWKILLNEEYFFKSPIFSYDINDINIVDKDFLERKKEINNLDSQIKTKLDFSWKELSRRDKNILRHNFKSLQLIRKEDFLPFVGCWFLKDDEETGQLQALLGQLNKDGTSKAIAGLAKDDATQEALAGIGLHLVWKRKQIQGARAYRWTIQEQ